MRLFPKIIGIALAFSLAVTPIYAAPKVSAAELATWEKAKRLVADHFKDPDSAKFRCGVVVEHIVSGEVNAKNSYGGYTGYVSFFVSLDGDPFVHIRDSGAIHCGDMNLK